MKERITQKLSEGLTIKNYKELCEILEEPVKGGKGKKYQMKEFERYFKYKKEGHKFIITEIFNIPKDKVDNRINNGGNNTKYDDPMDNIIINLLVKNKKIDESFTYLMNNKFKFFTNEYKILGQIGYKKYSEVNGMSKGLVMMYQQKTNSIVKGCLETSLNRLKRKGIIEFENNTVVLDHSRKKSFADEKTLKGIKEVEEKVYKEMNIIPFHRVNPEVNKEFKKKVCNYLDIYRYWNVYSFELIDKGIERVEEDTKELIERFTKSVFESVTNIEGRKGFGKKNKIYSADKFKGDLNTLDRLIWNL